MRENQIQPPEAVRAATFCWGAAVAAGVIETIGTVAVLAADGSEFGPLAIDVAVRLASYTVVVLVARQLWRVRRWSRIALGVGLGVFGTLSLVVEPLDWLLSGHPAARIDLTLVLVVLVRSVHVLAVLAACWLMFRPSANRYFRATRGAVSNAVAAAAKPSRASAR